MEIESKSQEFVRTLNLFDATSVVTGAMIGSGIFLVSAQIVREVHSASLLLLVWAIAGMLAIIGGLCYGEFAACWPEAGGQYVYVRKIWGELSGFVYGWSLFLVIQTGAIAAVSVAFAKFLSILVPAISTTNKLFQFGFFSLSTQQLTAITLLVTLTAINLRGIKSGAITQNIFTVTKVLALLGVIFCGIFFGFNHEVFHQNFAHFFVDTGPKINPISAVAVACVGAVFAADSWNNVTFIAGEIKKPEKNLPLSLFFGTSSVIGLYLLTNLIYVFVLPLSKIQTAREDLVATATLQSIFGTPGEVIITLIILISAFGCLNGMVLAGARVYYAMAKDGLFFKKLAILGKKSNVPENSLYLQCMWAIILVMSGSYIQLLEYEICAALLFYVITVGGIFVSRRKYPDIPRPYKAFGYPYLPLTYCIVASFIIINLLIFKPATTWPGFLIILSGLPVYLIWKRPSKAKVLEAGDYSEEIN